LRDRWNLLANVRGKEAHKRFFDQFAQIDQRFSGTATNVATPAALVLGWSNYRSLLVEDEGSVSPRRVPLRPLTSLTNRPARLNGGRISWWRSA
jgi:hypothetical protein